MKATAAKPKHPSPKRGNWEKAMPWPEDYFHPQVDYQHSTLSEGESRMFYGMYKNRRRMTPDEDWEDL